MSKGLLITEVPENCFECYFRGGEDQYLVCCTPDLAGTEVCEYDSSRPDFCPLSPMPEKKYIKPNPGFENERWRNLRNDGWNSCIDAILGGDYNEEKI